MKSGTHDRFGAMTSNGSCTRSTAMNTDARSGRAAAAVTVRHNPKQITNLHFLSMSW
jgi:hypothetical protein